MTDNLAPPDGGAVEWTITFFYYRDLAAAMRFYEKSMGFTRAVDQGWSKLYRIGARAHVGLVGEANGMHKSAPVKPVQLCIRVPDVDTWYGDAKARKVTKLSKLFENDALGTRAFVFEDPEGYQIEIRSATRPGA